MINIILGRPPSPTSYELWAADCNEDGKVDVGDIVCCINKILGRPLMRSLAKGIKPVSAEVKIIKASNLQSEWGTIPIEIENSVPLAGAQISLQYNSQALVINDVRITDRSQGFNIAYEAKSGNVTVLLYNLSGSTIAPSIGPVITLKAERISDVVNESSISIKEVVLVDCDGNSIPLLTKDVSSTVPLIREYSIQNYPSPCYGETEIAYQLPKTSKVSLKIYNSAGRLVKTPVNEYQQTGAHKVRWDGKDESGRLVASGIYFCHILADEFSSIKKIILLR